MSSPSTSSAAPREEAKTPPDGSSSLEATEGSVTVTGEAPRPTAGFSAGARADGVAYALAGLATLAFLSPFWLQRAQLQYDVRDYLYPVRFFIAEAYRSGELPLWFPYQFLGFPLVADPSAQPFYPPTILFSLLTGYGLRALTFDIGFHYFLCIALAYRCCRDQGISWTGSMTAGLVYGLNGFLLFHTEHANWITSAAWLPLIVLGLHRGVVRQSLRWFILAGSALGMLILGGYPAFFITACYAVPFLVAPWNEGRPDSVRALARALGRTAMRSACVAGTAALVAGIQLVPTMLGQSLMNRGTPLSLEKALAGAMHPEYLATLVLPSAPLAMKALNSIHFFAPDYIDISLSSNYLGPAALVLAWMGLGASRKARWVGVGALVFILLALGGETWARPLTILALPMMGLFRFPSLFMLFFNLALMLLVGWGLDVLREAGPRVLKSLAAWTRRLGLGALVAWGISLLAAMWLLLVQQGPTPPQATQGLLRALGLDLFFAAGGLLGLAAALSARRKGQLGARGLATLLCLLTTADLSMFWYRAFFVCAAAPATPQEYQAIHDAQRHARARAFNPERKLRDDFESVTGNSWNRGIFEGVLRSWGYNSYLLHSTVRFQTQGDRRLLGEDWVYLAGAPGIPVEAVTAEGDFAREPLTPGEGVPEARLGGRSARFTVTAERPRLLVVLQTAYPGWKATVDGEPRPIRTIQDQFIGVEVPPGQHEVLLRFTPPGWWMGCMATLLGAVLTLLALAPGLIPSGWRQRFASAPLL